MKPSFSTPQKWYILWLLMATIIIISQPSCNSEKRVAKQLQNLDRDDLNKKRPWPYNYTYQEYVQILDNAKIRQETYKKRYLQAGLVNDKHTQEMMKNNIAKYQKKIDRLEEDSQFHKIYKLREREIQVKIKNEEKNQDEIKKQQLGLDKAKEAKKKSITKQRKQMVKDRQKRLEEKEGRIIDKKIKYQKENKIIDQEITQKKKERDQIQEIAESSTTPNDPNFIEGIELLTSDIKVLETEKQRIEKQIEDIILELEEFQKEYATKNDTIIESQMMLQTDSIPTKTSNIIKALPDSSK